MKKYLYLIGLIGLGLSLSACQFLQDKEDNREARCKELKSRILLNGTTNAMQTQQFQERADQGKLNQSYHDNDCV